MIKCIIYVFFVIGLPLKTMAQSFLMLQEPTYLTIESSSKMHENISTFSNNPSLLLKRKKPTFSFFSEKKFNVSPLSLFVFSFSKPYQHGSVGLIAKYAGDALFHENQLGFCYSKKLSPFIDIGVATYYQSAKYADLQGVSTILDVYYHLNSFVNIGFSLANPTSYCWRNGVYTRINYKTTIIGNYDITPFFFLGMCIEKEEDQAIDFSVGMNYSLNAKMDIHLGVMDHGSSVYFGVGYLIKKTRLKIYFNSHPVLGLSPSILVGNIDGQ